METCKIVIMAIRYIICLLINSIIELKLKSPVNFMLGQ